MFGLLGNVVLVGFSSFRCAFWTETLAQQKIISSVHMLGFFVFPAAEVLAFFPLFREAWNGEFETAAAHAYRSAGFTLTLSPVIVIIAAGVKGRQRFIDLSTLQVIAVLATSLISVLSVAFMGGMSRLGHLLSGLLMLMLAVIGPLTAYPLDISATTGHAHGGGEGI